MLCPIGSLALPLIFAMIIAYILWPAPVPWPAPAQVLVYAAREQNVLVCVLIASVTLFSLL